MATKEKMSVDTEFLAVIADAHATNDKGMTSDKAIRDSLAGHGAKTSKGGIYVYLTDMAWNVGVMQRKGGKVKEADFGSYYDEWFAANMGRDREDDERKGDRSAFGAWAKAGFAAKDKPWLRDECDKVLAIKNASLSQRGGMVNKIIALAERPDDEKFAELSPNIAGGGEGGATLKGKAGALLRSVESFADIADKMTPEMLALWKEIDASAQRLKLMADAIKVARPGKDADAAAKARADKLAALRGQQSAPIKYDS